MTAAAHQVGNDRMVAVVFTNGEVAMRQDEGGSKLIGMESEDDHAYRGGYGYLTQNGQIIASSRWSDSDTTVTRQWRAGALS